MAKPGRALVLIAGCMLASFFVAGGMRGAAQEKRQRPPAPPLGGGAIQGGNFQFQPLIRAPIQPRDNPPGDGDFTDAVTLPTDRQVKKRLEAAQDDYIKNEAWAEASRLLQSILDNKQDVFVQMKRKGEDGKEKTHWISARTEADRLLGSMPANGLEFYESLYGGQAKNLLAKAKASGDIGLLGEIARRYFHTEAGAAAVDLLGTYKLDRAETLEAAVCYKRLLQREGADQLTPLVLVKAALAFRLAGDGGYDALGRQVWEKLSARVAREELKVDGEPVTVQQVTKELED